MKYKKRKIAVPSTLKGNKIAAGIEMEILSAHLFTINSRNAQKDWKGKPAT